MKKAIWFQFALVLASLVILVYVALNYPRYTEVPTDLEDFELASDDREPRGGRYEVEDLEDDGEPSTSGAPSPESDRRGLPPRRGAGTETTYQAGATVPADASAPASRRPPPRGAVVPGAVTDDEEGWGEETPAQPQTGSRIVRPTPPPRATAPPRSSTDGRPPRAAPAQQPSSGGSGRRPPRPTPPPRRETQY